MSVLYDKLVRNLDSDKVRRLRAFDPDATNKMFCPKDSYNSKLLLWHTFVQSNDYRKILFRKYLNHNSQNLLILLRTLNHIKKVNTGNVQCVPKLFNRYRLSSVTPEKVLFNVNAIMLPDDTHGQCCFVCWPDDKSLVLLDPKATHNSYNNTVVKDINPIFLLRNVCTYPNEICVEESEKEYSPSLYDLPPSVSTTVRYAVMCGSEEVKKYIKNNKLAQVAPLCRSNKLTEMCEHSLPSLSSLYSLSHYNGKLLPFNVSVSRGKEVCLYFGNTSYLFYFYAFMDTPNLNKVMGNIPIPISNSKYVIGKNLADRILDNVIRYCHYLEADIVPKDEDIQSVLTLNQYAKIDNLSKLYFSKYANHSDEEDLEEKDPVPHNSVARKLRRSYSRKSQQKHNRRYRVERLSRARFGLAKTKIIGFPATFSNAYIYYV